ncbi:MAG: DUF885 domain-containing protein [Candidatus Eiseniibacteriota bacterium]
MTRRSRVARPFALQIGCAAAAAIVASFVTFGGTLDSQAQTSNASGEPAAPAQPAWIAKSNAHAMVALEKRAPFEPEFASMIGVPGFDDKVYDLGPGIEDRKIASAKESVEDTKQRLAAETDPLVKQDLEIMLDAAERNLEELEVYKRRVLPYGSIPQAVFQGIKLLLDDRNPPERRQLALARLRRYAGVEPGTKPLTELAMDRWREKASDPALLGPVKDEVEKDLANAPTLINGIGALFEKYKIAGYEAPYATLKKQMTEYDAFVRSNVLPRARTDFRLPPDLYALNLKNYGVDMTVDDLSSRARVAFREIQNEMQTIAPMVAREKGLTATDYRAVLRELKKQQLVGEAILPHYQQRLKDIEVIIRREKIVSLPEREAIIRLADEAESAALPAPHMEPPRSVGNTGERGAFVLPLVVPGKPGEKKLEFDDFTFEAASWTLTAHEARPGHELQFAANIELGVSLARQWFAFNSTNAEGWGLYAEAEMKPYEPLEGQLVALQHRLLRAARAILDPGLQQGLVTREEATRVLTEEVVVSPAMALQEVERYTFRAPGQATSYFCGYQRLMELRADTERTMGPRFDRQRFHDFVLAQGMLPPRLLRRAVMEGYASAGPTAAQ